MEFTENNGQDIANKENLFKTGQIRTLEGNNEIVDINIVVTQQPKWNGGQLNNELVKQLESGLSVINTSGGSDRVLNWTYLVNDVDLNFLKKQDTIEIEYTVNIIDENGNTATDNVKVKVYGTNDRPIISSDSKEFTTAEDQIL